MCNFSMNSNFSKVSGSFKGGWVMSLEEGMTSWDLDVPFSITTNPPWIPSHCLGEDVRFGCSPLIHGAMKICLVYEGCDL